MVTIYGKARCPKCDAAKAKMALLKLAFQFVDINEPGPQWRDTQAALARAIYEDTLDTRPDLALPLIEVDGNVMFYPEAMARLRQRPGASK